LAYDATMRGVRPATLGPVSMLVAALVFGCQPTTLPTIPPVPDDALETLRGGGLSFRASDPPPGMLHPAVLLDRLRSIGRVPPAASQQPLGPATYGVVSCVEPQRCGRGPDLGVWVISFPGLGSMSVAWIVVDVSNGGRVIESGGR